MEAILYASKTGFTEQFARLLAEATGLPAVPLASAKLPEGAPIVYAGWLRAGKVMGYAQAAKKYRVEAVLAVGLAPSSPQQEKATRDRNQIPAGNAVFCLRGGLTIEKLKGMEKFAMRLITSSTAKKLAAKASRTPDEDDELDILRNGGHRVSLVALSPVLAWYQAHK